MQAGHLSETAQFLAEASAKEFHRANKELKDKLRNGAVPETKEACAKVFAQRTFPHLCGSLIHAHVQAAVGTPNSKRRRMNE
jgi:hypothetical protein